MRIDRNKKRTLLSWLFVAALLALCGVLGALQYRWIGAVSVAERDRLSKNLQNSLDRMSQDFNSELATATQAIVPVTAQTDADLASELPVRYEQWKKSSRQGQLFRRIALAEPQNGHVMLRQLDLQQGDWKPSAWPDEWKGFQIRMESRLSRQERPPEPAMATVNDGLSFEMPVMRRDRQAAPVNSPAPFVRREVAWLIFELNLEFVRETMLPELLQRHLGSAGSQDYQVEVVTRTSPPVTIYLSSAQAGSITATADASVSLFEVRPDEIFRQAGQQNGRGFGRRGPGAERGPGPGFGRWQMSVRHRIGSLEAVVERTRIRNLLVTAGVLLLMLASVAALVRFTRRAQKLAQLQMDFVAGVSHELRTPLTVIHTAAYNLRGKTANNPTQVERYGTLIQQESGRLKDLVEQVLRFSSANAGRVIQEPEPVSLESVIAQATESGFAPIQPGCVLEQHIDSDLPVVLGDPLALKQALQNLIGNAVKYGTAGGNWIGVSASRRSDGDREMVEIRVQDHGPGIPQDEQKHIFDPFFRGRRAVQDQVHGTGLGLNLVKKIVEAHGGTIMVRSEPRKGTDFILRLPAAPAEYQNGFANTTHRG